MPLFRKSLETSAIFLLAVAIPLSPCLGADQTVSFQARLLQEAPAESNTAPLITYIFSHELNRSIGNAFPVGALDGVSFQMLSLKINRLINDAEGKNQDQILESKELRKEMQILIATVRNIADPRITGICQKLGIDLESAEGSKGDWRLVKAGHDWALARQAAGSPIKPSSHLHMKLYWHYRLGCGGEKNLEIARKVLIDISDLEPVSPSERGELRAEFRHCEAEIWAKHGIGGPVDLVRAEQFSKRYTNATFFFRGDDTPEARAEMAVRYPDAAKSNLGCPQPDYYLDPRDPWKRLW